MSGAFWFIGGLAAERISSNAYEEYPANITIMLRAERVSQRTGSFRAVHSQKASAAVSTTGIQSDEPMKGMPLRSTESRNDHRMADTER